MSNIEFRQKMTTALEAMQKSCSDMCDILREDAGRNMELPQGTDPSPARRMWKRWECGGESYRLLEDAKCRSRSCGMPVHEETILRGHDAVEQIEREAYQRGLNDGVAPFVTRGVTPKAQAQGEARDDDE